MVFIVVGITILFYAHH